MTPFERKVVHDAVARGGTDQRVRGRRADALRRRAARPASGASCAVPVPSFHVKHTADASPPPPDPDRVAAVFFDDSLIYRYVDLLAHAGVERGLIGPREAPRLWDRHIFNCAAARAGVRRRQSGGRHRDRRRSAGVVLALARPDLDVTLVEPLLRRATFLSEVVDTLGLENVAVVRSRAEDVDPAAAGFDAVTSRAVAPLPKLARWCLPLARSGGLVLAMKGTTAEASWRGLPDLRSLGVTSATSCGVPRGGNRSDPCRQDRVAVTEPDRPRSEDPVPPVSAPTTAVPTSPRPQVTPHLGWPAAPARTAPGLGWPDRADAPDDATLTPPSSSSDAAVPGHAEISPGPRTGTTDESEGHGMDTSTDAAERRFT